MSVELKFEHDAIESLNKLPVLIQYKAADAAMGAVGRVIARRAKQLAPSSRSSGTRKKWSKKYAANPKWSSVDSGKHIGGKVFRGDKATVLIVGGEHPWGNKLQFNQVKKKTHRNAKFWGKDGRPYTPPFKLMDKAAAETVSQQQAAFVAALEKVLANG